MYGASLLHPAEVPGVRVPDVKLYRTGVKQTRTKLILTSVASSGTDLNHHIVFEVVPVVTGLLKQGTTLVNGAITASTIYDDEVRTFAVANWVNHRCVSMEVEVVNTTPSATMAGLGAFIRAPEANYNAYAFNAFIGQDCATPLQFTPATNYVAASYNWVPAASIDTAFVTPTASAASTNTAIHFWSRSTVVQTCEVSIVANWECTVSLASEAGISTQAIMGSEAAAADAVQRALIKPGLPLEDGNPGSENNEKAVWKEIKEIAPAALKLVPIIGNTLSTVASGVMSLFGDKYVEHMVMFARSLDEKCFQALERARDARQIPKEFVDAFALLRGSRTFYDGQRYAFCTDKVHFVYDTIVTPNGWGMQETRERVGRYLDDRCPACPPEFCVSQSAFKELETKVDELAQQCCSKQCTKTMARCVDTDWSIVPNGPQEARIGPSTFDTAPNTQVDEAAHKEARDAYMAGLRARVAEAENVTVEQLKQFWDSRAQSAAARK